MEIPIPVPHGHSVVFGYRIGPIAYITDAKCVPDEARAELAGVKVLVLNALFRTEHPTHMSVPEAVRAAEEISFEVNHLLENIHSVMLNVEVAPTRQHVRVQFEVEGTHREQESVLRSLQKSPLLTSAVSLGPVLPE